MCGEETPVVSPLTSVALNDLSGMFQFLVISEGVELLLPAHRANQWCKLNFPQCHVFPPFLSTRQATHLDFHCVSLSPLRQGLTGRPGDAGPQGKGGPSVSVTLMQ